ncbi:MAG: acetyl-CoA carboxylase biotin carboxylase subunit [Bacillati bacterium ANGP1]|uniref:biotin carboxylase n=1 Tax=Candidatus Segetimicrobium genomatis TaxID=2569760 RepID=A0A537JGP3_9BACT|nr:MAG: acetyl-CoA carboxylase biotin carboxylase subunit [Terrabacteria group bacterium ANGP1]
MRKVLIANRGEIAVRIIRACRELGLAAAAVYSEADRDALHVRLADDALPIGAADPRESYLNIDRLVEAARSCGADAVHPGYGFLAESSGFAAAVRDAGLTFVGPPPEVIAALGDKIEARRTMERAGIARRLGAPLLVKAAGGGGGRGVRLVERLDDLPEALESARREAGAAFGSSALYLERHLPEVHHIEIQILADGGGTVCHLGERECSVQRRLQKLIEETPSPFVAPPLRARLAETAVAAAEAVRYVNAGSVEFLVEPGGQFYFLEVNTRLQVEHPITEVATGVDLVKWQLRIAAGESLPREPAVSRGHAIECRIYAEDPAQDFAPSPGPILALQEPGGPGIRVDSGVYAGWQIPVAYDPLLAKVVAWDRTRPEAIARLQGALRRYVLLGCRTNLTFLQDVVGHEAFRSGNTTTRVIEQRFRGWRPAVPDELVAVAAAVAALSEQDPTILVPGAGGDAGRVPARGEPQAFQDPWERVGRWRMGAGRG